MSGAKAVLVFINSSSVSDKSKDELSDPDIELYYV